MRPSFVKHPGLFLPLHLAIGRNLCGAGDLSGRRRAVQTEGARQWHELTHSTTQAHQQERARGLRHQTHSWHVNRKVQRVGPWSVAIVPVNSPRSGRLWKRRGSGA